MQKAKQDLVDFIGKSLWVVCLILLYMYNKKSRIVLFGCLIYYLSVECQFVFAVIPAGKYANDRIGYFLKFHHLFFLKEFGKTRQANFSPGFGLLVVPLLALEPDYSPG